MREVSPNSPTSSCTPPSTPPPCSSTSSASLNYSNNSMNINSSTRHSALGFPDKSSSSSSSSLTPPRTKPSTAIPTPLPVPPPELERSESYGTSSQFHIMNAIETVPHWASEGHRLFLLVRRERIEPALSLERVFVVLYLGRLPTYLIAFLIINHMKFSLKITIL